MEREGVGGNPGPDTCIEMSPLFLNSLVLLGCSGGAAVGAPNSQGRNMEVILNYPPSHTWASHFSKPKIQGGGLGVEAWPHLRSKVQEGVLERGLGRATRMRNRTTVHVISTRYHTT